jgi:PKD repeat protein
MNMNVKRTTGLLLLMAMVSLTAMATPALADIGLIATRDISVTDTAPGDTFTVTVELECTDNTSTDHLVSMQTTETLPAGWIFTDVDNAGYGQPDLMDGSYIWQSVFQEMFPGDTITYVYNVTVPAGESSGVKSITGKATAYSFDGEIRVGGTTVGDTDVTIMHDPLIIISPGDSLQAAVDLAEDGDTIMMAPGTYQLDTDSYGYAALYINKPNLTFMADGGEVIIGPGTGTYPAICLGLDEDMSTYAASGTKFIGITFDGELEDITYNQGSSGYGIYNNMLYEDCVFNTYTENIALQDNTLIRNCTCVGTKIHLPGNGVVIEECTFNPCILSGSCANLVIENNTGTLNNGNVNSQGLIVRDNTLHLGDISGTAATFENNVIEVVGNIETYGNSIVRYNDFSNSTGQTEWMSFEGQTYLNNFYNCQYMISSNTGEIYNTSTPVTYTYRGASYTGYLGNYYSDYNGTDSNGDGVGEDPFISNTSSPYISSEYAINASYPLIGTWNAVDNEISESAIVAPVADFSADVTSGTAPLTVNFTDASTDAESWSWDFDGDGVEDSNETNPQFTYDEAGSYNVSLTVSNSEGSDSEVKSGYITCTNALPVLSFAPGDVSVAENHYTEINITVSSLPEGLSGYNFTVTIDDPAVADIVDIKYPAWANLTENSSLPGSSVYLKTADITSQVGAGEENIVLATITVSGNEMGSASLTLDVHRFDDDNGSEIEAELAAGTLEVTMVAIPGQTASPQDLDGDGIYEDLTGDGSFSFVDVEVYFHHIDWIEDNLLIEDFDLNENGRIDFDDIVDMFQMLE